jgi:hypothetical protein
MASTSQTSERDATGIPATVRCREDPDGIVIWLPVDDEPDEQLDDEPEDEPDEPASGR